MSTTDSQPQRWNMGLVVCREREGFNARGVATIVATADERTWGVFGSEGPVVADIVQVLRGQRARGPLTWEAVRQGPVLASLQALGYRPAQLSHSFNSGGYAPAPPPIPEAALVN